MKSTRSWRVEWAIGGLLLLPFAIAKPPLHLRPSTSASHVRNGGIAERKANEYLWRRRYLSTNASTTLYDSRRGSEESSSFIKRSRPSAEPSLPEYPIDKGRTDTFPDTQPHVTEPESDIDSIWARHPAGEEETELPHENHEEQLAHSPVVYQYFGRSRSRVHTADSIPFILLGPTVDHWKTVGHTLASRGFSVMACEIVQDRENAGDPEQGKNLILAVLDALRWNRAILVGCDSEAALAIEAAIQLAPERVKGLVLCGDLTSADQMARRAAAVDTERLTKFLKQEDKRRHIALDALLNTYLECPYTLIWDGDVAQAPKASGDTQAINMNSGDMFRFNRCLILGGGTAPHRRRPEQFAWALTRFVEEKVAPRSVPLQIHAAQHGDSRDKRGAWKVPGAVENIFSQGSLLVAGRIFASVVFYVTAMKIAVYQYDSLRGGVVSINSLVQYMRTSKQRVFQSVGSILRNPLTIFSLLSRRRSSGVEGKEVVVYEGVVVEEHAAEEGREEVDDSEEGAPIEEEEEEDQQELDDEHQDPAEAEPEPQEDGLKDKEGPTQRLMLLDLVVV